MIPKIAILLLAPALLLVDNPETRAEQAKSTAAETLAAVPAAEMPAKAAELVARAEPKERPSIVVEVIRAGVSRNPSSASLVVAAICRSTPDLAPIAAGAAAEMQPRLAAAIARAAVGAVPMAGKGRVRAIVAAVCRAAPKEYKNVAIAAGEVAPTQAATREILEAVSSVFPQLKQEFAKELRRDAVSISAVLEAVNIPILPADSSDPAQALASGSEQPAAPGAGDGGVPARGPIIAPPYVPYSSSGPNLTPSGSDVVPRGHRNYAAP